MRRLLFALLLLIHLGAAGQYFETGQDPSSIKWRQINTENFQLIYPDYYEDKAQELAQKLEVIYEYGGYSLGYQPKKISIVLHTQTVRSNGLVAYAPKHSEFYTTPHQASYPQDWLEQLVTHEFRHVVQLDKVNEELPKILKLLFGEQGTALVFGSYLPWWFIEGDAVATETALSNYGRGRFPSFLIEHKAAFVEKNIFSYDKAYLGSYKSYVPNHYNLGYYLVANARKRYGSKIWETVINRVAKKPFSFVPFNKALKLEIGMGKVQLYNSIFDSLSVVWKKEDRNFKPSPSQIITPKNKTFTNYTYKHWVNTNEIVAFKTSLNKIPSLVKLNINGEEQKIHQPGTIFNESMSFYKEWVVWSEQKPNLRWQHSGRSEIFLLNLSNNKKKSFFPEFKAFAPAISPNLDKIALVEADFSSNYYLSVYRISDGKRLSHIQTSDNNYFFSPTWKNNEEVVALVLNSKGKQLTNFHIPSGKYEALLTTDLGDIKHLTYANNKLYFIASYSGKNALYSFDFMSKEVKQVYEPRFGAAYPAINSKGEIILSDYTADGFRIIKLDNPEVKNLSDVRKEDYPLAESLAKQEKGLPSFSIDTSKTYTSKKYRKATHLLNFHSWAPIFIDAYNYESYPGVSLMSQNKLGTAETILGYKWDPSESTSQFYVNYIYKGWYPKFSLELSKGKRASKYLLETKTIHNGEATTDTILKRFTWNNLNFNAGVSLPLNFSSGIYHRFFQPQIKYQLTHFSKNSSTPKSFKNVTYNEVLGRLYYHQLMRKSHQDVYPNFGFVVDGIYKYSKNNSSIQNIFAGQAALYAPGISANHGVKFYGGIQNKTGNSLSYFIKYPRGWGKIATKQSYAFTADYKLPLLNPDFSFWGVTYIRRIEMSLFADYANLEGVYFQNKEQQIKSYTMHISSYGFELVGDLNFFRFYAPVKIGVRSSYLPKANDFVFDLLFSIDFESL